MRRNFVVLSLLFIPCSLAADVSVPSTWRKPSISKDRAARIDTSAKALDQLASHLNVDNGEFAGIGFWQSGNVWSAMAKHDWISQTTRYKTRLLNSLNKVFQLHNGFDRYQYNDDALWWATAAIYAHQAYGDTKMVDHAVATWDHVSKFQISAANANSGSIPGKSFKIQGKCNGKSMVGGVFWRPVADNNYVNSITTGLFLTLSGYLWEIKKDAKFKQAAESGATWMHQLMLNSHHIPLDGINSQNCKVTDWTFTYNAGKLIEGLAILAQHDHNKWYPLMTDVFAGSLKSSPWQGKDGIISEGNSDAGNNDSVGFKAVFIRALREVHHRYGNTDLEKLTRSYLSVQYNALLDLAKKGDAYSANWHGPPHDYTAWGQLAAVDVLAAVINV